MNRRVKRILLFDDKYGRINSHWPYDTKNIIISDRQYYDEPEFKDSLLYKLSQKSYDAFVFSGRKAPEAARILDSITQNEKSVLVCNRSLRKVFKLHNTNLSCKNLETWDVKKLNRLGNDWVRAALSYPFDVLLVQTYGDCEIFNQVLNKKCAFWVPYCYNDHLFYPRNDVQKNLDIGAFFKLERHDHRIAFLDRVKKIADKNGYSFEFSDEYWGEAYAENICRPKVMLHLSYCGDIPWRLYECAASKTCLLTDPLSFHVERLFTRGKDYIEYKKDFSDLEVKITLLLDNDQMREDIVENAYRKVQNYTWERISDALIYPLL